MKRKLLFFPSAWSNESVFTPQIEYFQDQFEIIFPDIHSFDSIEKMTDFVIAHYQDVYALIGLSMGGFIVQDILCRFPEFAQKAVLMGTYCHGHDEKTKAFYQSLIDKVKAGHFEEVITLFTSVVTSKPRAHDSTLIDQISALPRSLGETCCINHHKACISWSDHSKVVQNIKADTLILAGDQDQAVPLADLELLQGFIPQSKLVIIQHAGHLMTLEAPDQVNEIMKDFLA